MAFCRSERKSFIRYTVNKFRRFSLLSLSLSVPSQIRADSNSPMMRSEQLVLVLTL